MAALLDRHPVSQHHDSITHASVDATPPHDRRAACVVARRRRSEDLAKIAVAPAPA
jgi:hypothetical protein